MATQTSQSLTYDNVLTATLINRRAKFIDQVEKQLVLFWWLRKHGRYKAKTGHSIQWPVRTSLNQSEASFNGFDVAGLQERQEFTTALASWKEYREDIVMSQREKLVQNTGPEQLFDLYDAKEAAALAALQEQLGEHFYLDGLGNDAKRVTGLNAMIPEDPTTGTLFGINRATAGNEYWRSRQVDRGAAVAWSSGDLDMHKEMLELYILCGRGKVGGKKNRFPDFIICTEGYYASYSDMLTAGIGQRFINTDAASAGFANLMFQGSTLFHDEDCPQDSGSDDQAYFLNSEFLELCYAPAVNFLAVPPERPLDQAAWVAWIYWAGELILLNANKQGKHHGLTPPS